VLGKAVPVAIFLGTLLAFVPALDGQFVNWDDDRNFVDNPAFRGLGWTQLKWMWTTTLMGHYIPLTWMSLGLNYVLGGMNPWGYHLGSMLIHSANAVLFYFVSRRLLAAAGVSPGGPLLWGGALAALVFGLHPLRVESVAWVTERRDVLCGFFFLLAVLTYLRSVETDGRTARWRALSLAAFIAALLSKAQALPLPLALLILDVYPLRRVHGVGWRRVLVEKLPYMALSLVGAGVALIAVKQGSGFTDYHQYGPAARLAMTAYGIVFYPWKWLWPVGLSPLYELPARVEILAPRFLAPMLILIVVSVLLVALRHRWPGGLAAWVYSAVMVLPVVGPVHAGHQLANDRYSYLSGLGFAILAGAALAWVLRAGERGLVRPFPVRVCGAGALLVLLGFGSSTWTQAGGWKDSETLWAWAVELDPRCAACASNLGEAIARDRPREAEAAFLRSLSVLDRPLTRSNLGAVLELQGRLDEAERAYRQALGANPDLPEALANLGVLYAKRDRAAEALPLLRRAFRIAPEFPELRTNLSLVLRRRATQLSDENQGIEASALVEEARTVAPGNARRSSRQ
jgi:Tfp pilus assembly protein PilF